MHETLERRIAELLNDPLTGLLIAADHVDRDALAEQLRGVAELTGQPENFMSRGVLASNDYEPMRHPRRRATKNTLVRLPLNWCGAHAQ